MHSTKHILSYDDIDPDIIARQREWVDLLYNKDLSVVPPPPNSSLTSDEIASLAAIWFKNGSVGRSLRHPRTAWEIRCYRLFGSQYWIVLFTLMCFTQLTLSVMLSPQCSWDSRTDAGYVSITAAMSFDVFAALFYMIDAYLKIVSGKRISDMASFYAVVWADVWVYFRVLASIFLLADVIYFFVAGSTPRLAVAVVPFIYLSRRKSFQLIVEGMLISFYEGGRVVLFLQIGFLLLTSFMGYVLLQNLSGTMFNSIQQSIFTVLQSITSRSYALRMLRMYYEYSPAISVYFVSLVIFGDLICMSLIIAVGNRQFRIFSAKVFQGQIRNRKEAVVSIHEVLSDDKGLISRLSWLKFCKYLDGKSKITPVVADSIFELERRLDIEKSCIDCIGFVKLCALISENVTIEVSQVPTEVIDINDEGAGYELTASFEDLSNTSPKFMPSRETSEEYERFYDEGQNKGKQCEIYRPKRINSDSFQCGIEPRVDTAGIAKVKAMRILSSPPSMTIKLKKIEHDKTFSVATDPRKFRLGERYGGQEDWHQSVIASVDTFTCENYCMWIRSCVLSKFDMLPELLNIIDFEFPLKDYCGWLSSIPFVGSAYDSMPNIKLFPLFFAVVRVLLAVKLTVYSSSNISQQTYNVWAAIGFVLLGLMIVEMFMLIAAQGLTVYLRRNAYGLLIIINIVSLVLMIIIHSKYKSVDDRFNGVYYGLLIVEVLRFPRFLTLIPASSVIMHLVPLLVRIFFVVFAFVYFFSVFGHAKFCNIYDEDLANSLNNTQDGFGWVQFKDFLHFRTLGNSMLTMLQVAVIGNWTPIMSAGAEEDAESSYLFFFTFRLVMTAVVIPMMLAFMINAFIAKRDDDAKNAAAENALTINVSNLMSPKEPTTTTHLKYLKSLEASHAPSAVDADEISPTLEDLNKARRRMTYTTDITHPLAGNRRPRRYSDPEVLVNLGSLPRKSPRASHSTPTMRGTPRRHSAGVGGAFPVHTGIRSGGMMSHWKVGGGAVETLATVRDMAVADAVADEKKLQALDDLEKRLSAALAQLKAEKKKYDELAKINDEMLLLHLAPPSAENESIRLQK